MINQEKRYREEFIKLMQENPDIPVVPTVDDDCGRWMGSFGSAQVDEYLISKNYCRSMLFKSDDDVFDTLERFIS